METLYPGHYCRARLFNRVRVRIASNRAGRPSPLCGTRRITIVRVLMLSWEYPPMRVGGIAAALEGLCPALARAGIEVHVITSSSAGGEAEEQQAPNLWIHRVAVDEPSNDFIHWVHLLNGAMERRGDQLITQWQKE